MAAGTGSRQGKDREQAKERLPNEAKLTARQARRLADLSGVEAEQLVGTPIVEIAKRVEFGIDPAFLWFRRICGRVVRTDPATGNTWGVPGATVHLWDTDVNLFGYFPESSPYGWFLPWGWRREELGTTQTDSCGDFCIWIPRFDLDWILRWRRQRHCYIDVFRRPTIGDLIKRLREVVEIPPHIGPWPEPDPLDFLRVGVGSDLILDQALGPVGKELRASLPARFGEVARSATLLDAPAHPVPMPIPDSAALRAAVEEHVQVLSKDRAKSLAAVVKGDEHTFRAAWLGPFIRCYDIFVPEFESILDVPDITFTVTQDVDGDGAEEEIYSEGLFDVRWDAGSISPVTLHAKPFAFATPFCADVPDLPCSAPELVLVGHMPLKNPTGSGVYPIIDTASGYAVRPNRSHASGRIGEVPPASLPATAPLGALLEFWGCAHAADGTTASHYRIQQRVSTDGGATFGPWQPILDNWMNWRVVGFPSILEWKAMTQLPGGWWEVLDPNDQWMPGDHYLLQWHAPANGTIELRLELGSIAGTTVNQIGQAPAVRIVVDNSGARAQITSLAWRVAGQTGWPNVLPLNCPTIHRNHQDIEIKVGVAAWATHLRSVAVGASGCGSGSPALVSGLENLESGVPPNSPQADYWHRNATDNNVVDEVVYSVPAGLPPGAYSVSASSYSRAFHPGDGHIFDPAQPDVNYNPWLYWEHATLGIAIVD